MDKKEVAAVLEEIALLSDDAGKNPFKVRAYETGAWAGFAIPAHQGLLPLACSPKR